MNKKKKKKGLRLVMLYLKGIRPSRNIFCNYQDPHPHRMRTSHRNLGKFYPHHRTCPLGIASGRDCQSHRRSTHRRTRCRCLVIPHRSCRSGGRAHIVWCVGQQPCQVDTTTHKRHYRDSNPPHKSGTHLRYLRSQENHIFSTFNFIKC